MAAPVIGNRPRFAPRPGATIDCSHPLAQGLEFCFVPAVNQLADLAHGYVNTKPIGSGSPDATGTWYGLGSKTTATKNTFQAPDAPFQGALTLLWVGTINAPLGFNEIAHKGTYSGAQNLPFGLYVSTSTTLNFRRAGASGSWEATRSISYGTQYVALFSAPLLLSTFEADTWINGVYTRPNPVTTSESIGGTNAPIVIGNSDTSNNCVTNVFGLWSRRLSQAEANQLYANPFCFLRS